ncbi:hypothetical protein EVG20_g2615 [Dentipellis fragilis]|uniref:Uncharacterized protein n=1 Tax=Dentipellis fragilis TaxID=205917 RepID=A0A4Y9Z7F2_9AGAM|nr:hypothetical protein EVG20_g2615 [Dentipellis fragilis]
MPSTTTSLPEIKLTPPSPSPKTKTLDAKPLDAAAGVHHAARVVINHLTSQKAAKPPLAKSKATVTDARSSDAAAMSNRMLSQDMVVAELAPTLLGLPRVDDDRAGGRNGGCVTGVLGSESHSVVADATSPFRTKLTSEESELELHVVRTPRARRCMCPAPTRQFTTNAPTVRICAAPAVARMSSADRTGSVKVSVSAKGLEPAPLLFPAPPSPQFARCAVRDAQYEVCLMHGPSSLTAFPSLLGYRLIVISKFSISSAIPLCASALSYTHLLIRRGSSITNPSTTSSSTMLAAVISIVVSHPKCAGGDLSTSECIPHTLFAPPLILDDPLRVNGAKPIASCPLTMFRAINATSFPQASTHRIRILHGVYFELGSPLVYEKRFDIGDIHMSSSRKPPPTHETDAFSSIVVICPSQICDMV